MALSRRPIAGRKRTEAPLLAKRDVERLMEAVDGPVAALQDALATALGIVWEEPELAFADAVAALDVADDIRILLLDGDADALWDLAKLLNEERTAPRHSPTRRR